MSNTIDVDVTLRSRLAWFPFEVSIEGDGYIIGRPGTAAYIETTQMGLDALTLLGNGQTIEDTKQTLALRYDTEHVELGSLLQTLLAAGFVRSVDLRAIDDVVARRRYHLTAVKRESIAWLFSRPFVALWLTLVALGGGLILFNPSYLPGPTEVWVADSYLLTMLLGSLIGLLNVAKHEIAHVFAGKYLGIESSVSIGRRLFFPVVQTDMTDLWRVDKRSRYLALSAGMLSDIVCVSLLATALWVNDLGVTTFGPMVLQIIALTMAIVLFGVLWQFNFFMRTDVYYILSDFLDCRSLYKDTTDYLRSMLYRVPLWRRPSPLRVVTPRDLRIIRAYAAIWVVGTASLLVLGALFLIGISYILIVSPSESQLLTAGLPEFGTTEKIVRGGMLAGTVAVLAYATVVKRHQRRRIEYRLVADEGL